MGYANVANRVQYTAHGAMSQVRRGNGLWEHTNFNSRLQPIQIGLGTQSTNSSVLQLDYSYGTTDNNGNTQSQTITVPGLTLTQSYTYDGLNRLDSAREVRQGTPCLTNSIGTTDCWKQTFSYDRYGNRRINEAATTTPVFANPAISDTSNQINSSGYRYDAAGNLECDPVHQCGETAPFLPYYKYDAENRMKEANGGAASGGSTYAYDGEGRRVKKSVAAETTVFVYNVIGELIAEYTNSAPSEVGGTSYLTADHLGTPRVITRQDQSVKVRRDYLPFGEEISASDGGRASVTGYAVLNGTRQQFTQKERDNETNLDYFLARYYSSTQGRFTSVDPENAGAFEGEPQSWNGYAYVQNNPLGFIDANGLERCAVKNADGSCAQWVGDYDGERSTEISGGMYDDGAYWNDEEGIWETKDQYNDRTWDPMQEFVNEVARRTGWMELPGQIAVDLMPTPGPKIGIPGTVGKGILRRGATKATINITRRGLRHVLQRHSVRGARTAGKSVFNAGEDIAGLIRDAERVPAVQQAGQTFERVVDAGRIIGTDRATGQPTSTYTVITDAAGNLKTAFPGKP